jgi:hypothetical protein
MLVARKGYGVLFSTLKTAWQEAKTDVAREARVEEALKEAVEILRNHERMDAQQRHKFASTYQLAKSHLENAMGASTGWTIDNKIEAAEKLRQNAIKAVDVDPHCAMSIALLSLFYEAQTLPGERAREMAASIGHWYIDAVVRDINRFAGADE